MKEIIVDSGDQMTFHHLRERYDFIGLHGLCIVRFHRNHTHDVFDLPGFVPAPAYHRQTEKMVEDEVGAASVFRFAPMARNDHAD